MCGQSESEIELGEPEYTSERRERLKAARTRHRSYASDRRERLKAADGYDLFDVHESACEAAVHTLSVADDAQDQPEVGLSDHPHHAGLANDDDAAYGAGEHASDMDDGSRTMPLSRTRHRINPKSV